MEEDQQELKAVDRSEEARKSDGRGILFFNNCCGILLLVDHQSLEVVNKIFQSASV